MTVSAEVVDRRHADLLFYLFYWCKVIVQSTIQYPLKSRPARQWRKPCKQPNPFYTAKFDALMQRSARLEKV